MRHLWLTKKWVSCLNQLVVVLNIVLVVFGIVPFSVSSLALLYFAKQFVIMYFEIFVFGVS